MNVRIYKRVYFLVGHLGLLERKERKRRGIGE